MEEEIKKLLNTSKLKATGYSGGGCISSGATYEIDDGILVFVKTNHKEHAKKMFDGEHAGLEAILATNTILVPKSFGTFKVSGSGSPASGIVLKHINMKSLKSQALLGQQLAELHLHNVKLLRKQKTQESVVTTSAAEDGGPPSSVEPVTQFGFPIPTSCGYISMNNDWNNDWTQFYINRLQAQIDLLYAKSSSNRNKLSSLWPQCSSKIEELLSKITPAPALLHGDLWSGNFSANEENQPLVFDPAAFYGHSEFDLGITQMFGGFNSTFYNAYHKLIPKTEGFEQRLTTYELFHHLNHWNHFGSGYESGSLSLMKAIIKG